MSEPIIVNGSKLTEEELKQLLEEIKKAFPEIGEGRTIFVD